MNNKMPYYYHISLGPEESEIVSNYRKNEVVYFNKKDISFNLFWKDVGKDEEWGGYREYELFIPKEYFTESLNPRNKGKIYKLTKRNKSEFKKFIRPFQVETGKRFKKGVKFFNRSKIIEELKKRGFGGLDTHYQIDNYLGFSEELIIFDITPFKQSLKLIEIYKN